MRVLDGVAGTDNVGRPFPMLNGGFECGTVGGGMDEKAASSRAAVIPLVGDLVLDSCPVWTGAIGKLPIELDESTDPLCGSDAFC